MAGKEISCSDFSYQIETPSGVLRLVKSLRKLDHLPRGPHFARCNSIYFHKATSHTWRRPNRTSAKQHSHIGRSKGL